VAQEGKPVLGEFVVAWQQELFGEMQTDLELLHLGLGRDVEGHVGECGQEGHAQM